MDGAEDTGAELDQLARDWIALWQSELAALASDPEAVEALRTAWGGRDSLLLGWIGRMVPIKRVDKLLQAVAEMNDPPRPFRLVLVGDGPEKPRWEALARQLGLSDKVVWAGLRWDIPEVLRALDAVVLVSDNEGTPVTLIEALACGVPVASTPVGGVPDLLAEGEYGYLLQEPLPESLRLFIAQLPQARAKAQKAQPFIRSYYSEERLIKDIRALYRQLLSSPNFAP
jgi:glycosyltransferase involved in cell wall biosynthesis